MALALEKQPLPYECRWNAPELTARMNDVIQIGKHVFAGSEIVNQGEKITYSDVDLARQFLVQSAPDPKNWYETGSNWYHPGGPAEHIAICSAVAGEITKQLIANSGISSLSVEKMMIVGLLHDLGRLVSHDFFATDMLSDILARHIGINPSITDSMHKIDWYWKTEEGLNFDDITPEQRISAISDVISKRHSDDRNRLRRPHEILDEVKLGKQKYLKRQPKSSSDFRMREIIDIYSERENYVLGNILSWLEANGIQLESIIENLEQSFLQNCSTISYPSRN